MPEGENRVILSSDLEPKPSREQRQGQEGKEQQKEKLKTREYLDRAVLELKNLLKDLPRDSKEGKRAEHTLRAVEWALGNLGKNGAGEGKYRLEMKDHEGKPAKWPEGSPAVQDEGVPVDELIDLLKGRAQELNTEVRKKDSVKKKKQAMDALWERYNLAHEVDLKDQTHDKAWVYSQWEQAKKAYEAAQEAYELGYDAKGKELDELAGELYKRSETHFQAHFSHELPLSKEESDKQNVRTTHEAYLIHHDYRKTKNKDQDYQAAMDAMGKRRELILEEKKETEIIQGPTGPTEGPVQGPTEGPTEFIKGPERVAIVNAEAQVELLARKRANERLTEMFNGAGRLKKMWYRAWEEGYRQQLIDEERKKILGEGNKANWLKRKLFGAKEFDATGKKNLFAGTASEGENKTELTALAERFSKGYIKESEGEQKEQLQDPEFNSQLNDLVFKYVEGGLSDEEFEKQKDEMIAAIGKKYPESFAAGKLTADNFLEAAREFKKIHEHSKKLARVDINLGIDLGNAKQAIKTQANLKWTDRMIAKLQKYPGIGHVFTPGSVGFGVSVGGYLFKKPLYFVGGAAGAGGILGGMRRNFEQKRDLEMHRIEAAMGNEIADYGPAAKRRQEMEKYVHEMKNASEVSAELASLRAAFEAGPSPENAAALTKLLAETEARMSLSEERQRDLISFDGETTLERGRLFLLKELAEAKVKLGNKGFDSNIAGSQDYKDFMASLGGNMDKLEKSEKYKRWKENTKAAAVGAVTGLVVGGLAQQGAAEIGDRVSWLSWLRPGGRATGMERLYHFVKGDLPTAPSGAGLAEVVGIAGAHGTVKIDGSTELVQNRSTGLWNLVDKADHTKILAEMDIDPASGQLTPRPGSFDHNLIDFSSRTAGGGHRSVAEWMQDSRAGLPKGANMEHLHTEMFYDNDTPAPKFDFNELRFYMHADPHGNITMDAGKIREYLEENFSQVSGSRHGERALDIVSAFKSGEIKIAIAPDPDHPGEMFTFQPNAATGEYVLPAGSEVAKMFGVDGSGNVTYKGNGFMGMIENPKGSAVARWINSIRGNGEAIETGPGQRVINEITRKYPREWWMPWIGIFRRKALEQKQKKELGGEQKGKGSPGQEGEGHGNEKPIIVDTEGKKIEPKFIYFEEEEETEEAIKKKLLGKKFKQKVAVDTRGQKITNDRKDYGKDYPQKFPFKDEKQMADYLVNVLKGTGKFFARAEDLDALKKLDQAGKVKFLEERIKKARTTGLELRDGVIKPEAAQELTSFVLNRVNEEFAKYGQAGRSEMPDASKVHIVSIYEFQAQAELGGRDALGLCFTQNGEIFINYELIKEAAANSDEFVRELKRTIAHEVVHGGAAANYWAFEQEADGSDGVFVQRRTGLKMVRRENASTDLVRERGRALNEAVTETLAKDITDRIYKDEGAKQVTYRSEPYQDERNVLKLMQEKFHIPFTAFAEAVVNRKALKNLAELLDGKSQEGNKVERPQFMSLLMSIMDYEHNEHHFDYAKTKQLIQGAKGLQITPEMKLAFPASLLDRAGNIKASLVEQYDLVDMDAVRKLRPKAA